MAAAGALRPPPGPAPPAPVDAALCNLVYRSRAVAPLGPAELGGLVAAAQARNRAESVTGVVVYDDGRFLQWLEGPAEGVGRVAASGSADARHADVEVLHEGPARGGRRFAGRDARLAARRGAADGRAGGAIEPTPALPAGLHRRPESAPSLLAALAPAAAASPGGWRDGVAGAGGGGDARRVRAVLERVAREVVLPGMLSARAAARRAEAGAVARREAEGAAAELARRAVSGAEGAEGRVPALCAGAPPGTARLALLEGAARALGDLWAEDACGEAEVAIALCRLQSALRAAGASWPPGAPSRRGGAACPPPAVLVAPPPFEPHALGAALDAEALRLSGCCRAGGGFPRSEGDLLDAVASAWFDALDLALSPVFRRGEGLPALARLAGEARRASRNPRLAVVVSGRLFAERPGAWREAAADAGCGTALGIGEAVAGALRRPPAAAAARPGRAARPARARAAGAAPVRAAPASG